MRTLMLLAILGATSAVADPAQARFGGAASGAWCLFTDPYTYNCGFATLQQCRATASGAGGQCQPNPSGPPLAEAPARRKREKPRY
jgi:hypothetical protein